MAEFESSLEVASAKNTIPLDMSHRQMSTLDYPVLPHLVTHLYLNDNHLTSLPKDFFKKFVNVQWLDLRNNLLTDLPNLRYSIMILPYGPEGGIKNTIRSPRAEGEARSPRAKGWYF